MQRSSNARTGRNACSAELAEVCATELLILPRIQWPSARSQDTVAQTFLSGRAGHQLSTARAAMNDKTGHWHAAGVKCFARGDVQRPQIFSAESHVGEHVLRNGDSPQHLPGRFDDPDAG